MRQTAAVFASAALAAGATTLLASPQQALAYQPKCQTTGTATTSSSAPSPGQPVEFSATFKDCNGHGQKGATVTFKSSGPADCTATFATSSGTTDANGSVTTRATLSGRCRSATELVAETGEAVAGAAVTAPPAAAPPAPVGRATSPRPSFVTLAVAAAVVLVAGAGGVITLRRIRG